MNEMKEKEETETKKEYLITTEYEFITAKTDEILEMKIENTLEYILWLTRNRRFENDMDAFRKYLKNILGVVHQINMKAIDRYIDDHIKVVIE